MRNLFLMLGSIILVSGCGDGGIGGFPQVYPEAPEGKKFSDVLTAAETVVKEHYPMSATSIRSQHVFALGRVALLGGSRTQKQVSVWVRKTYTGHWGLNQAMHCALAVALITGLAAALTPDKRTGTPRGILPLWHTHLSGNRVSTARGN